MQDQVDPRVAVIRERTLRLMEERAIEIENGLLHQTPAMEKALAKLEKYEKS